MNCILLCLLAACSRPAPPPVCPPPLAQTPQPADHRVVIASPHDHATTVTRLAAAIEARGLAIVHRIDHAAAARSVDLTAPATTVLVFGNPKVGTPLIQAAPTIALDLPLRMLVVERDGRVEIVYRAVDALAGNHDLRDHPAVAKITGALAAIAAEAVKP